jgi:O-antigen/teichoic acid export membrane protein
MPASRSQQERPSLTKQAGWLLAAKLIGFALSFAVPLFVVRVLDQREFGLYKQAFLLASTAGPILTLGFQMNAFYFLPRHPERGGSIVLNVLIVHLLVGLAALGVLTFDPSLLYHLFGSDDLTAFGPLIGLVILVGLFGLFLEVVATANQDIHYSTAFIILSNFTRSVAMIAAAMLFGNLRAILYAAIVQAGVQSAVLLWYLAVRFPRFWSRPDWRLMRQQIGYAVPLGFAGCPVHLQAQLHLYMVANRFSAAEYAIYVVGCFQVPLIELLHHSVNSVMVPRMASLQQQQDGTRQIGELLARAMRKLAAVCWPLYAFLIVCADEFITLLYTSQYAASVPIFRIFLTTIPLSLLISDPVMRAYASEMRFLLKVRYAFAVLLVVSLYFAIESYGTMGAVSATVGIIAGERLVVMHRIARLLHLKLADTRQFMDVIRLGAAAMISAAAAAGVRWLMAGYPPAVILLVAGAVLCGVYAAAVALLRVLTADEWVQVRRKAFHLRRVLKAA